MLGIGATDDVQVEVISAYSASSDSVQAVVSTPGWTVIGSTHISVGYQVRVEVTGSCSKGTLIMHVRLYDVTLSAVVSGSSVTLDSTTEVRSTSGEFTITGGHVYQYQVEVVLKEAGTVDGTDFGIVNSATLIN